MKRHPHIYYVRSLQAAVVLLVISAFFSVFTTAQASDRYDNIISIAAKRHKVDPLLIKSVIWQESMFKPNAVGKHKEVGLMQIKTGAAIDWAKEHNVQVPPRDAMFEPKLNIEIGSWYLSRALKSWKNYRYNKTLALCEYNAGRKKMKEWLPPRENEPVVIKINSTRIYVISILNKYSEYSSSNLEISQND